MKTTCAFICLVLPLTACTGSTGTPDTSTAVVDATEPTDVLVTEDLPLTDIGPGADADGFAGVPEDPGERLRKAGWLRGDLHMHTLHSDGDDAASIVIGLAEYSSTPTFQAAHPEFEGNELDFIAITDHRTVAVLDDPEWVSDRLLLVPGEEYGGPCHANAWGIGAHVPHDPGGDGTTEEDVLAGIDAVHDQGGVFSMNHPFDTGTPFPFDVRTHDAVEVWNTAWALMSATFSQELLQEWEAEKGAASPFFRKAVSYQGVTGSEQALRFYEAQLALGIHVAVVGGSDHHVLLLNGFPTTWVRAESPDVVGFTGAIRSRHTFVSRRASGATLEVSVDAGGQVFEMGDAIPVDPAGESVVVRVRVGRADGGLLRLMHGRGVAEDDALADAELGSPALEEAVVGDDFTAEVTLTAKPGDWFYPVVLEPVVAPGISAALAAKVPGMIEASLATGAEDYDALLELFWDVMDFSVVLAPDTCDPGTWEPDKMQCIPVDDHGIATFYVPDWVDRALNAVMVDGAPSDWCMGAVGSAVLFHAP